MVDQHPELRLARLCYRCRVLEDLEFLRTQVDNSVLTQGNSYGESPHYGTRCFTIVSWQNLKIDQMALSDCEFCRLISSEISLKTSNSRCQSYPTEFHVDIQGIAVSRVTSSTCSHKADDWVIHSFRIKTIFPEGGTTFDSFDVIVGTDEG